jgi:hypothetical protein
MPRITHDTVMRGGSAVYDPDAIDDLDLDTADRGMRDRSMRGPMHETSDSFQDARTTPRMEHGDIAWRQPMSLDAPPARPGYVQRWIRMAFRDGSNDTINVQGKSRSGWAPRDPSTVPEGELFYALSTKSSADGGLIRVGNLVLHECPVDLIRRQRAFNKQRTRQQEESVSMETEKASREGVRAGYDPIVRDERAQVTTGRRPQTLAD